MKRTRILVVDDDPRLVHIVQMYLGIEGYDVVTAESGEDGLRSFEQHMPDLVILDIMMPGMDGVEVCRRMRQTASPEQVSIIMFSALSGDEDVARALDAGATHMIAKPFNLVGLGAVVRSFLPSPAQQAGAAGA